MVKDHSDSEKGNPLPPHGLLFPINSKGSFICTIHGQDSTYHGLYYTSRGALAGTSLTTNASLLNTDLNDNFFFCLNQLFPDSPIKV